MLLSRNSGSGDSSSDDSDDSYASPENFPERSRSPLSPISPPPVSPPNSNGPKQELNTLYQKDLLARDLQGTIAFLHMELIGLVLPKIFSAQNGSRASTPTSSYDPFFANAKAESSPPIGSPTGLAPPNPDYNNQPAVFQPNPVRSRKRKNENQMGVLMKYYEQNPDPDLNMKKRIADETRLTVKQVSDWFYNLRVRKKFKVKT
jgi:hypothetical protein